MGNHPELLQSWPNIVRLHQKFICTEDYPEGASTQKTDGNCKNNDGGIHVFDLKLDLARASSLRRFATTDGIWGLRCAAIVRTSNRISRSRVGGAGTGEVHWIDAIDCTSARSESRVAASSARSILLRTYTESGSPAIAAAEDRTSYVDRGRRSVMILLLICFLRGYWKDFKWLLQATRGVFACEPVLVRFSSTSEDCVRCGVTSSLGVAPVLSNLCG